MLIFPPKPKVGITIDGVITSTVLDGILFNFINTITLVVNI